MINTPNVFNPEMEVETLLTFSGPVERDEREEHKRQYLTFDDLETWEMLYWLGRDAMITGKGESVSQSDGRHLVLDAMDKKQPQRMILHESWVNNWLDERMVISPAVTATDRWGADG